MKKNFYFLSALSFALFFYVSSFAQSGNALSLDGVNSFMGVSDHPDLDIAPGQSKTITCWIRTTSTATSRIFAKRAGTATLNPGIAGTVGTGYEIWMGNSTNAGKIAGNASAWDTDNSTSQGFSTPGYNPVASNDGMWHHLAVVFDNSSTNKTVTFYVDGTNPNSKVGTFPDTYDFSTAVSFVVGAATNATNFFGGQIDDVRIWNVAMSQAQVQTDMTAMVHGPVSNLLAAWDFETVTAPTVPDISGNGHQGTLNGAAVIVPVQLSNKVLTLDGTAGTYMSVVNHNDINIGSGISYTISCKVKTNTVVANPRILAKRNGVSGTAVGYEFISSATGQYGVNLRSTPVNAGPAFSTATINNNQWHHLAMVVDQVAGNSKIYIDGVLDKTSATWAAPQDFSNTLNLFVGADATASHTNPWTGQIDDIRMWNKAMSAAEVQADGSTVISGSTTNLMACWDFENVSGNTVPDVSGNIHPGSLNGNASIFTVTNNMTYQSTALVQTELPAGRGDADQRIIAVNVQTSGSQNPITLNSLSLKMTGTTNIADVSNIKIYYTGNSSRFAATAQFASVLPAAGTLTASGTQYLESGNNYFWIAYDVSGSAIEGDLLDATCESLIVGGTAYTLSPPNNTVPGSRTVLLANKLLFAPGDAGSVSYRIPAIVTAADGSLVTVTDKRWNNTGDLPNKIDLVVRRSTDNGQSWSAPITISNFGQASGTGDASLVLDKVKKPGTLLCVFAANVGFLASTPSNPINIQYSKSTDNGITWSLPTDITNQVYGAGCSNPFTKGWYGAFVASGRMYQLRSGRIVAVLDVRQTSAGTQDNFTMYSDDGGTTWAAGTSDPTTHGIAAAAQANEAKIVELDNGNLMISTRHAPNRLISISTDAGATWGAAVGNPQLVEPSCDGDFIRYTSTVDGYNKSRLLHSIPNNSSTRQNVSVFISYDEGATWNTSRSIFPRLSAYSSLNILPDGTIGMYYENGEYGDVYDMYFTRFSLNWLTGGADNYSSILPLHMISFEGRLSANGKQALLQWQTADETNSSHFEVEYGVDGRTFSKVGEVVAANNTSINNYVFTHDIPSLDATLVYYRLKIIDRDGKSSYSSILSFNKNGARFLSISPNPVTSKASVSASFTGEATVSIIDATSGQINRIFNTTQHAFTIDMSALPKKLYLLKLKSDASEDVVKIMKQ